MNASSWHKPVLLLKKHLLAVLPALLCLAPLVAWQCGVEMIWELDASKNLCIFLILLQHPAFKGCRGKHRVVFFTLVIVAFYISIPYL